MSDRAARARTEGTRARTRIPPRTLPFSCAHIHARPRFWKGISAVVIVAGGSRSATVACALVDMSSSISSSKSRSTTSVSSSCARVRLRRAFCGLSGAGGSGRSE